MIIVPARARMPYGRDEIQLMSIINVDIRRGRTFNRRIAEPPMADSINGGLYRMIRYKPRIDEIYYINPVRYEKYDVI